MHVLIAPDAFGAVLSAQRAAATIAAAWRSVAPGDDVVECPLADGGPGFVETLRRSLGGDLLPLTVHGPLGDTVPAAILVVDDGGVRTAYVESAHAVGLPLVPTDRRDPGRTTTRGVGDLLVAARDTGATRIVVGLGGSSTNDAGAGMLVGAGLDGPDLLTAGGATLGDVTAADLADLGALRERWAGVEVVAATDVDVPLLGLTGASAGFAPQKGASPEQAQDLERALSHLAHLAVAALGDVARPDLLAGARASSVVHRFTSAAGAGAAGGLGFGLSLLGARLVPGAAFVADAVGLDARIAAADVVVTGEGRFDWQSLHGKVAAQVAARALAGGVPTVVLAGEVTVGRREQAAAGITAAYAVAETPAEVEAALADPETSLSRRAVRVARTWSR